MPEPVIKTTGLTRRFGSFTAVDNLDLEIMPGQFYGFLGPNGAGKSTTIKMLTGLLAPTHGTIEIFSRNMADHDTSREIKRRIGVVPENLTLFDNLTGREFLTFVGRMYGMPVETVRQRADELLNMLDLAKDETKLTLEYSHGMRKKLAMAAAIIAKPDLLFLDEPFEGVDAVTSRTIRDILKRFVQRGGTVFLTSHVLEIVEKLCTEVGIIAQGKLVLQQSMADLQGTSNLEDRFIQLVGGERTVQPLAWLEGEA